MADRIYNVLFLCTGNTARSILAESILTKDGAGRFKAFSAGSQPKGTVNPFALKVLEKADYPTEGFRSKSWDEFAVPGAPTMDFVFTVCDAAAGEECPPWPGQPITGHWGLPDPVKTAGSDAEKGLVFAQTYAALHRRIAAFVELPFDSLNRLSLQAHVDAIGTETPVKA